MVTEDKIEKLFRIAGFELGEDELRAFRIYLEELKKWNRVHNLTAIREDEQIVKRHFIDSLTLAKCFSDLGVDWKGRDIADVGSGAGFPGVPLKIHMKDINLFLIESVGKKCSFLEVLKLKLGLEWTVVCDRAQNVRRKFDIVVARALGEFQEVAPLLERLSRGYVFVMKGKDIKREWVEELGYEVCEVSVEGLHPSKILFKRVSLPSR